MFCLGWGVRREWRRWGKSFHLNFSFVYHKTEKIKLNLHKLVGRGNKFIAVNSVPIMSIPRKNALFITHHSVQMENVKGEWTICASQPCPSCRLHQRAQGAALRHSRLSPGVYHLLVFNWRRQWHPTPVLLPGKSHGRRSLVGCSPWGREESDTTERLPFHFSLSCLGEGNGNPLQCSCLENPMDGEAW